MRGDGDASQDDGEDENTHTSDKRLPLPGHLPSVSLRGIVWPTSAKKKSSAPCEGCEGLVAVVCHDGGLRPRPDPCSRT